MTKTLYDSEHPLAGPFRHVFFLDGSYMKNSERWDLIMHSSGTPVGVTDGKNVIPWHSIKRLVRDE